MTRKTMVEWLMLDFSTLIVKILRRKYSRVSNIRNQFLRVRSKPVSYRMRLVSRECFSFLFEELSSVLELNRSVQKIILL